MDNLDEALGKLLSDPNAMAQIASLAQSIGSTPPEEEHVGEARHVALLRALMPFLSPGRRQKLERAMQLAKLSSLAGQAKQLGAGVQEGR